MVGRPSVDGQPRPDPATGERDRQPKPVQLWGDGGDGEGEKGERRGERGGRRLLPTLFRR